MRVNIPDLCLILIYIFCSVVFSPRFDKDSVTGVYSSESKHYPCASIYQYSKCIKPSNNLFFFPFCIMIDDDDAYIVCFFL